MAFDMESVNFLFDELRVLRFIRNSSNFGKMSTVVRRANEKQEPDGLLFALSSGEWTCAPQGGIRLSRPQGLGT